MKLNHIAKLHQLKKIVFTTKDLAMIWGIADRDSLKAKLSYYAKTGALIRLTRGVYAKDKNYNPRELALCFSTPSYVSFETVLRDEGVIFQHDESIFVASRFTRKISVHGHSFHMRKLKDSILFNPEGIITEGNYQRASKERAFLDMIYLSPNYHFDHLQSLDWKSCFELVSLYQNKQLVKRLHFYYKNHAE